MKISYLIIFTILLLSGCVQKKTLVEKVPVKEIPIKEMQLDIEVDKLTQDETFQKLGAPTNVSLDDRNLYGDNMKVVEKHAGATYDYDLCELNKKYQAQVKLKLNIKDPHVPALTSILTCTESGKKRLYLSYMDGKLKSFHMF